MDKALAQFQTDMARWTIAAFAWEIAAAIVFFFALYLVVKAAVRDGINESRIGARPPAGGHRPNPSLPDMTADR